MLLPHMEYMSRHTVFDLCIHPHLETNRSVMAKSDKKREAPEPDIEMEDVETEKVCYLQILHNSRLTTGFRDHSHLRKQRRGK